MFEWWQRVHDHDYAGDLASEHAPGPAQGRRTAAPRSHLCPRKDRGTCHDILKREAALWTFVHVVGIEPTNNLAERQVRPGVLWRKMCFGTQSEAGSRFAERIMTVIATLKQQQRNVLEYLTEASMLPIGGDLRRLYSQQRRPPERLRDKFSIPPENRGVPFLVVADVVLIGSLDIPQQLPGLIETYLAAGGVDWPDIPGLAEAIAQTEDAQPAAAPAAVTSSPPPTAPATLDAPTLMPAAAPTTCSRPRRPHPASS